MAENQGTKSSIEMFDLDNMGNEEGLSDQVFVINDFEIEQEGDLTLQATHMGSDKAKAAQAEGYTGDGAAEFKDSSVELQRLHVRVGPEELDAAEENGQIAIIQLDLSEFIEDGVEQAILRNLPEGTQAYATEDPEVALIAIDPTEVQVLNIQVDVVPIIDTGDTQTSETPSIVIIRGGDLIPLPPTNYAPEISAATEFDGTEDNSITLSEEDLLANATDRNIGDTLSVENLTADTGTITDNNDGTWTFTPDENFNGDVNLTYDVSDGTVSTPAEGVITVEEVNDAAVVGDDVEFDINEDGTITISADDLLANASDVDGDTLSIVNLSVDDGSLTDNGDGTWTFTPDENFNGDVNISYDVSDGTVETEAGGTIDIAAVNDGPVVFEDTSFTMNEDGTITLTEDQLLANASDVDGDDLSVSNVAADGGTLTDNGDGTWTFEPADDFNGNIDLSYDVSDGTETVQAGGSITVEAVNDGPVVSEDTSFTMNEDGTITLTEDQLLANASDVDGDDLSVSNVSADGGTLTDNGDGTWTFEPADDFNGNIDLSYDVSDGTETVQAGGSITVEAVNDGPVVSEDTSFTMNEDGTITLTEDQLLANASDVDGDDLSVSNVSADGGTLTDNGDGTWTFEPADDFNGNIDLSYDVSDGTETVQAGGSITVEAVNDGPVVSEDTSFTMNEDGTITLTEDQLLANASDVDGDDLSVSNVAADGGTLTDNGDGTWTFEPADDFNGNIDLSYDVSDGTETVQAGGSITVEAVNDGPVVSEDTSFTMNEDGTITLTEDQLLANASDVDGDDLLVSNVSADGGTLTDNGDGTWTFEPADDFNGNIDLSYDVSDGTETVQAGGSITVEAVNDGPVVSEDTSFSMDEDTSMTISEDDLLTNASDVDGDDLSVENLVSDDGTLVDNGDGTWSFTPDADFAGDIDLSYDVTDGTDTVQAGGTITVDDVVEPEVEEDNGNNGNNGGQHANNGHGNGDQDAPGNSADNNNAENSTDNDSSGGGKGKGGDSSGGKGKGDDSSGGGKGKGGDSSGGKGKGDDSSGGGKGKGGDSSGGKGKGDDSSGGGKGKGGDSSGGKGKGDDSSGGGKGKGDSSHGGKGKGTDAENENVDNDNYRIAAQAEDDMGGSDSFTQVIGGSADDTLSQGDEAWRTNGDELYQGNDGSDTLGNSGNNYGEDLMIGGDDGDIIDGGSGHDVMYGDSGNNIDAVNDTAQGDGNDTMDGGSGHDEIYGEGGDDVIDGGSGNDFLVGGSGDDDLVGDSGNDTLHGGSGDDSLEGGSGNDELQGGSGDDTLTAGTGNDNLGGGSGDDVLDGQGGNDDLSGGAGDDTLMGGQGNDDLSGGDGNDTIYGDDAESNDWGNDTLDGGAGDDTLMGGNGSDTLNGGDGNDTLDAGDSWDSNELNGGDGDDTFYGGQGNDTMNGGEGDDLFYFGEGSGDDTVDGGDGAGWMDTVYLQNEDGTEVNEDDWTIELESGSIEEQADGYIELSEDAEGTITFTDGSELDFDSIDRFEW